MSQIVVPIPQISNAVSVNTNIQAKKQIGRKQKLVSNLNFFFYYFFPNKSNYTLQDLTNHPTDSDNRPPTTDDRNRSSIIENNTNRDDDNDNLLSNIEDDNSIASQLVSSSITCHQHYK